EMGDKLLVEVVGRMQTILRDTDVLGRVGGDEFVLVAEQLESPHGALTLAHRLVELLSNPFHIEGREIPIGASVGVAFAHSGDSSPSRLLRQSDTAMYKAKERGHNLVQMFDSSMQAHSEWRIEIEQALRGAVKRHELELHYQPLVNTKHENISGFEALLRWRRRGVGLLLPNDFVPVAEESDVIIEIGDWVLNEACRQIAAWDIAGRATRVSVNISGRQLTQPDIVQRIAAALKRHGAKPTLLVLEITESFLLEDAESAARVLKQMKGLGVRLAIDDFGTGYSSLTYLRRFPVDVLKIDRGFVSRLGDSVEDESIIEMIINLAHTLGLKVVAEGVERAEQLVVLRKLGATYAQGFYFAEPMPVTELQSWLDEYEAVHGRARSERTQNIEQAPALGAAVQPSTTSG
ncbi:MAG: putative bifunctional diguanylate cyclase/phosphodiesterase, partial [Acidimicrobiales bacterium]